ncbi:polysaccharide biosynthesis protein [Butyricimonas virosa]|jgi:FlaA1/EpsC-like NDP-sugar epimerase|uniref:Polysaccharide biosynthesis protein n=1 Tax=Butyricimonas virosa TaxID=544645 RepID=A0ABX7HBP5_9BACT|nr:polysaccharide biosynthesis protein [Butyricimonas virosa]QRO51708.1 polysaccharide biosynthesis protein [Butyricimonas virosa]UWO47527.1 polysaccharide biosynthesis protein [Butyricimonas virosa]
MIDINIFISEYITKRPVSMFAQDIESNKEELLKEIQGKKVLVIGGAGTIGSSFIRAILPFKPIELVVVDISENGLTELTRDLRSTNGMYVPEKYRTYPINYADPILGKIFREANGFDIVANFSAHKHVRSEKDQYSVEALLENNVIKARCLLDLLVEIPPKHFFCVSTDKAANPVNVMGASKKIMEDMIFAYSDKFKISTARFANVAFSNGSLLAGFIDRLMKKQPLVAPLDVKRYFVSPDESGQICMLSCILGKNKEIFFPKLGEEQMLSFAQICDDFLHVLGYEVKRCENDEEAKRYAAEMSVNDKTYPVVYFNSDTTGEKSFEEFYIPGEKLNMERFGSLGVIEEVKVRSINDIDNLFFELKNVFAKDVFSKEEIVKVMKRFIPNFEHVEKGKNLDQKM